ncbi:MAG: preprotein translocase subunit SecY [Clostridia bacterium]|nr:preprotein translocase subunit SecY [Clostridia bacterium]
MIQTIKKAWRIPELRKKILFTALIILICRLGAAIPVPFLNIGEGGILGSNTTTTATFLDYINMMSGDAFNFGTIFALSITPYINSSIIIQLLTVAIPALERLSKEGEEGRKKIAKITRYTTVALGILQGTAYYVFLRSRDALTATSSTFGEVFQAIAIILILTAGTAVTMWLGEQINDKGIGNGISIILFAGIVSRIPQYATQIYGYMTFGGIYYALVPIAVVSLLLLVVFIVWMDNAERRIPVQYSKRVVGRKMYGGQSSNIPIKVNMSGVLPVIFASSILSLPSTIQMFVNVDAESGWNTFFKVFTTEHWAYSIIYFVLIIFFAYFYSSIQYNPIEMANNLAKNSGTIPGVRTGRPTSDYIARVISKIVLLGALLLSVVALFPILYSQITSLICTWANQVGTDGTTGVSISLGGTSIIILVGVALETVRQLESQMMMRHYKGFLD